MTGRFFYSRIVLFIFMVLVIHSCLDRIDLGVEDGLSESVVVDGRLVKGNPSIVTVSVSNLFDFNAEARKLVLIDEAKLRDGDGNEFLLEQSDLASFRGEISNSSSFVVDYGRTYQISVKTRDGRHFLSRLEELLPVPEVEKWEVGLVEIDVVDPVGGYKKEDRLEFYVTTPLNTDYGSAKVLWENERTWRRSIPSFTLPLNYCYITDRIQKETILVTDGSDFSSDVLERFPLLREPIDERLAEGSYFHLYQSSLSQEAFEYFSEASELFLRSGNMFESRVGRLRTNVTEVDNPDATIFGYFFVTDTDTIRVKVDFTLTGELERCPGGHGGGFCLPCRLFDTVSFEKPDYWE